MWQIVVVDEIVNDAYFHHILEHQKYVFEIWFIELIKDILNSCDENVNVTWCFGILEGSNGVD